MNEAETIQAAIEKLEHLKAATAILMRPVTYGMTPIREDLALLGYRTIDAQLAILRKAHDQVSWYTQRVGNKDEAFTYVTPARRRRRIQKLWGEQLDLARAILGEDA